MPCLNFLFKKELNHYMRPSETKIENFALGAYTFVP